MPQGAKGAFPKRGQGRANECARGASPERGLRRAKTLPDDSCASRDSGVTPERHQIARSATPE